MQGFHQKHFVDREVAASFHSEGRMSRVRRVDDFRADGAGTGAPVVGIWEVVSMANQEMQNQSGMSITSCV